MVIRPTSCVATTRSGSRCRKNPVLGEKHCRSHNALGRRESGDRERRRQQDRNATASYWENNPDRCSDCKQWEAECQCFINNELCYPHRRFECGQCVMEKMEREIDSQGVSAPGVVALGNVPMGDATAPPVPTLAELRLLVRDLKKQLDLE